MPTRGRGVPRGSAHGLDPKVEISPAGPAHPLPTRQAGQTSRQHRLWDETYVKVNGVWRNVYWVADQHGQVIDVLFSKRRDGEAARQASASNW